MLNVAGSHQKALTYIFKITLVGGTQGSGERRGMMQQTEAILTDQARDGSGLDQGDNNGNEKKCMDSKY